MTPLSILDLTPIKQGGSVAATFRETAGAGAARGSAGLSPLLAGGASQHPQRGGRGHRGADGPCRRPHQNHPHRRGRDHAAQPCAADGGGTVRHPGRALSRPHRPGAGPRRPLRSRHLAGAPAHAQRYGANFPAMCRSCCFSSSPPAPGRRCAPYPAKAPVCRYGCWAQAWAAPQLAASLGLPFAFAAHFAPDQLDVALATYRGRFTPSAWLDKPQVMLSLTVVAADTR